jgi:hypothetical protein
MKNNRMKDYGMDIRMEFRMREFQSRYSSTNIFQWEINICLIFFLRCEIDRLIFLFLLKRDDELRIRLCTALHYSY